MWGLLLVLYATKLHSRLNVVHLLVCGYVLCMLCEMWVKPLSTKKHGFFSIGLESTIFNFLAFSFFSWIAWKCSFLMLVYFLRSDENCGYSVKFSVQRAKINTRYLIVYLYFQTQNVLYSNIFPVFLQKTVILKVGRRLIGLSQYFKLQERQEKR